MKAKVRVGRVGGKASKVKLSGSQWHQGMRNWGAEARAQRRVEKIAGHLADIIHVKVEDDFEAEEGFAILQAVNKRLAKIEKDWARDGSTPSPTGFRRFNIW